MKSIMSDMRRSLWDMKIVCPQIGNYEYVLQGPPERGGSCMVYHALRKELICGKVRERRVWLKEFYPVLDVDKSAGVIRQPDGTILVPEATQVSEEYQKALKRFQESYGMMLDFGKTEDGAEHSVIPLSLMEANGTWYIEEAYDTGKAFTVLFSERQYNFIEFLQVYKECLNVVERMHILGYYHLDLKPQNISYTRKGVIKLFDMDSFVKKGAVSETR